MRGTAPAGLNMNMRRKSRRERLMMITDAYKHCHAKGRLRKEIEGKELQDDRGMLF
jgi:hypothetical protein